MKKSRLARTVVLGVVVAALGIWWLARAYEVESATLLGFLMTSVVFVAGFIVLALAGAVALRTLRRRRPPIDLSGRAGRRAKAGQGKSVKKREKRGR